jgi:hypothetical protein
MSADNRDLPRTAYTSPRGGRDYPRMIAMSAGDRDVRENKPSPETSGECVKRVENV